LEKKAQKGKKKETNFPVDKAGQGPQDKREDHKMGGRGGGVVKRGGRRDRHPKRELSVVPQLNERGGGQGGEGAEL